MSEPAVTIPLRRARLGRYALWQARDYVLNRGLPTLIVAVLLGYLGISELHTTMNDPRGPLPDMIPSYRSVLEARAALQHQLSTQLVAASVGILTFLGALFATNGIVSNDRKLGFYRFLFAKPLSPSSYYGTEFLVNGASFMLLTVLVTLVYGRLVEPILSLPLLLAVASGYLCYSGLGFALSALSRWDWLSLVVVAGVADLLWGFYRTSSNFFVLVLRPLFPPVNRTSAIYEAAARGLALPWHSILWLGGYGIIAFITGLAILRHRRLAFN